MCDEKKQGKLQFTVNCGMFVRDFYFRTLAERVISLLKQGWILKMLLLV